ncbi:MAG: ribonuclease P protein component [Microthrixaceae bacterium]
MVDRISDSATFAGFGRGASATSSGPLTFVRSRNSKVGSSEFAFAIPRKVGSAVVRNRIRRQIRAVIDQLATESRLPEGAYLIVVRPDARGSKYSQLMEWTSSALGRAERSVVNDH